jgi:prolyl oligopeptidase PreP (S9A serine peptidase family)
MTEMQLGLRFQMFGQPVVTGLISDNANVRAGSDEILTLPEGSTYDIVSPEGNVEAVIENIKWQIELVALNNHLFVTFAQSGGEVPSGISLMIKDLERHEDFIDDKELYRQYEKEFYKVEYALSQVNNLGLPEVSQFKVDFSEVEYPMTTQDKIMLNEYKLKHNLTTQAQLLADENKDLSISDAEQIIAANKSVNQVEVVEDDSQDSDEG